MGKTYQIEIQGERRIFDASVTYEEIAKEYADCYDAPIMLARLDEQLRELHHTVERDGKLELVTLRDPAGRMTYVRSLIFLMEQALREISVEDGQTIHVLYTMDTAYYCELFAQDIHLDINVAFITRLEKKMQELVEADLPIEKYSTGVEHAKEIFEANGLYDKRRLFEYRRVSSANIYKLKL